MSNESKVREAFEQHALSLYGGNDDAWLEWLRSGPWVRTPIHGGGIDERFVGDEWAAWQASRADALEEAADLIERRYISDVPFHKMRGYLASAIRALAAKDGL